MKQQLKKGAKSSITLYTARFGGQFFSFLITIFLARELVQEHFGAYNLIKSGIILTSYLSSLGIEKVLPRYISEFTEKNQYSKIQRLFFWCLCLRVVVVLFVCFILYSMKSSLFNFFNVPAVLSDPFALILLILIIERLRMLLGRDFLSGYVELHHFGINNLIYNALKLVGFILVLSGGFGLKAVIQVWVAVESLSLLHFIIVSWKKIAHSISESDSKNSQLNWNRIVRFGLYGYLTSSFFILIEYTTDNLIIGHYLGAKQIAIYSAGFFLANILYKINPTSMLKNVFSPIIVKRYVRTEDETDLVESFTFLNKISFVVLIPASIGLFLIGDKVLIYALKPDYAVATNLLSILIIFLFFKNLTYSFHPLINALEKNEFIFLASLFSLYNLAMDIVLVPIYGVMGAALATGSTGILMYLFYWAAFRIWLEIPLTFPIRKALIVTLNFLPSAILVYSLRSYITNVIILLLVILLSVVIYGPIAYLNRILSPSEQKIVSKAFGTNIIKF